jgi:D-threo-aldose 1-dehydrogenase
MSRDETIALLETALDCGVSHFDTARMYGAGAAEGLLGELAKRRRADMTIVTKAGITPRSRAERALGKVAARLSGKRDPGLFRFGQFSPAQVRQSVETSLRELQTDRVDALLLHEAALEDVSDDLKCTLADLKQSGAVGALGVATTAKNAAAIVARHPELGEIVQISAPPPGARLPQTARLIVHSVLGQRLSQSVARLRADAGLARRFVDEVGADGADPEVVARLFIAYEMERNQGGVVLFASKHARHIEQNAAVLTQPPSAERLAAFERFITSADAKAS